MRLGFYDRAGHAVAYSDDGEHVFLFGGEPIAYLDADALYSSRGELLGWFESGWLRDNDGRCVAFSQRALGGPPHAPKQAWPRQSPHQSYPLNQQQDPRSLRPIHSNAWPVQSDYELFCRSPLHALGGLGTTPPRAESKGYPTSLYWRRTPPSHGH